MTTLTDVESYRLAVDDLTTAAMAELRWLLNDLGSDPIVVRDGLLRYMPEVLEPYLTASGELAAGWYEELREAAVGKSVLARPITPATPADMERFARWAVSPEFGQSSASTFSLVAGGAQRLIANAGRATIANAALEDRTRVGFARIPRPGCCAFCSMLASRGAAYTSEESARVVSGKRGKRGSRVAGTEGFHDNDRCVVAPVFASDTFDREVADAHAAIYDEARKSARSGSTKDVLAEMRSSFGLR